MSDWIPTSQRHPADGETVLAYWPAVPGGRDDTDVVAFTHGIWHDRDHHPDDDSYLPPGFWMALPTPPDFTVKSSPE